MRNVLVRSACIAQSVASRHAFKALTRRNFRIFLDRDPNLMSRMFKAFGDNTNKLNWEALTPEHAPFIDVALWTLVEIYEGTK